MPGLTAASLRSWVEVWQVFLPCLGQFHSNSFPTHELLEMLSWVCLVVKASTSIIQGALGQKHKICWYTYHAGGISCVQWHWTGPAQQPSRQNTLL